MCARGYYCRLTHKIMTFSAHSTRYRLLPKAKVSVTILGLKNSHWCISSNYLSKHDIIGSHISIVIK